MEQILELKDLQVTLHNRGNVIKLVEKISFSVAAGECLGILGESGSGKSMSLKAAMGLLDRNFRVTGSAKFQGEELLEKSAEQLRKIRGRRVGIVLQNPMMCFDPLYRIGDQIGETFAAHYLWEKKEILERSIEMLDIMQIRNSKEVLKKYPHQLSGGMLQRIMIGMATVITPELLIADEPTTAIDAITQFEILNELLRIKKQRNMAMIFVSHDLNVISRVADRIVVLNQGKVVDCGDFSYILNNAKDPYTKILVEKRAAVIKQYKKVLEGREKYYD